MCLDEGSTLENSPLHRFFPFNENLELRTHQRMLADAKKAAKTHDCVNGIKGPTPLVILKYIDLPKVFVVDWMHCVLLGVVKKLMQLWFDPKNKAECFYLGDKMALLNKRLMKIKIPDFISRRQRPLTEHSHWKASECREWLIHFSVPVLYNIMKGTPYVHYLLLVTALAILSKDDLHIEEITFAEKLVDDFCRLFPGIYGCKSQTMNVHLLRHLAPFSRLYGPLFAYSCFGFESMNSHLKKMVHGTGHITNQIAFAVQMTKKLPALVRQFATCEVDSRLKRLALQLGSKFLVEEKIQAEAAGIALGKKKKLEPSNTAFSLLPEDDRGTALYFGRLQKDLMVFGSESYQKKKKRNSYTVAFGKDSTEQNFGVIENFVEVNQQFFAVIREYDVEKFSLHNSIKKQINDFTLKKYLDSKLCSNIWKVGNFSRTKKIVPVQCIRRPCVLTEVSQDVSFLSYPPNVLEHN